MRNLNPPSNLPFRLSTGPPRTTNNLPILRLQSETLLMPSLLRQLRLKPRPPSMRLPIRLLRKTPLLMLMLPSLYLRRLMYWLLRLWIALHQLLQRRKMYQMAELEVKVVEVDGVEEAAVRRRVSRRVSKTSNYNSNKQVRGGKEWTMTVSKL